jgi:hypothetical protein
MMKAMTLESLVIARRFCGPPNSGNGGYVCGRVAAHVSGAASVRLKAPPPLDTELLIARSQTGVQLLHGDTVIAEGKAATVDLEAPAGPSFDEAQRASAHYLGFTRHVFPTCFVCGPQRAVGDGLRIFPGAVASGDVLAAPWIPDSALADTGRQVRGEFLWAALDCTSVFPVLPVADGRALVLGELAARIEQPLAPETASVVIGWAMSSEGRKRFTGSAIYAGGTLIAVARAVWIDVDAKTFGGVSA